MELRTRQALELEFANSISSFMKDKVGKGPRDIKIRIVDNLLIFFVYGVLTNLEKHILNGPDGEKVVLEGRKMYLDVAKDERLSNYEKIANAKIVDHFEGWNLKNDSASGIVVFDKVLK